jgi:hypothetical protein
LPQNARIELSFDRLLLPASILRQTFVLNEIVSNGATTLTPTVAYDPVARVVTVTPLVDQPLVLGQTYQLFITSPSGSSDPNGLRAIDGATLSSSVQMPLEFHVVAPAAPPVQPPTVDYCNDLYLLLAGTCGATTCHGGSAPAEGLLLTSGAGILSTAIDRVAHGSNMGPLASPEAPGLIFNEDVPIIDPGAQGPIVLDGGPPSPASSATGEDAGAGNEDAGAPSEADPGSDPDAESEAGASDASTGAGSTVDATTGVTDASGGTVDATTVGSDATVAAADAASVPGTDAGVAVAPSGDPAHSWIIYKLLMAVPPDASMATSPPVTGVYTVACDDAGDPCPTELSSDERSRLANLIQGREMPYPESPEVAAPNVNPAALSVDELELMSFWIAQGAPTELSCASH